eukprot:TRINITY_DN13608_c0_g1_i1.p1 TRINITY_DN13608_c0_g1~~TRINITY_DN13608_c0_g1_i1.p1  ORF type:complete len:1073 (+),score=163.11 TRINITY_DN13608_c0_g1_i1:56-3220(+)
MDFGKGSGDQEPPVHNSASYVSIVGSMATVKGVGSNVLRTVVSVVAHPYHVIRMYSTLCVCELGGEAWWGVKEVEGWGVGAILFWLFITTFPVLCITASTTAIVVDMLLLFYAFLVIVGVAAVVMVRRKWLTRPASLCSPCPVICFDMIPILTAVTMFVEILQLTSLAFNTSTDNPLKYILLRGVGSTADEIIFWTSIATVVTWWFVLCITSVTGNSNAGVKSSGHRGSVPAAKEMTTYPIRSVPHGKIMRVVLPMVDIMFVTVFSVIVRGVTSQRDGYLGSAYEKTRSFVGLLVLGYNMVSTCLLQPLLHNDLTTRDSSKPCPVFHAADRIGKLFIIVSSEVGYGHPTAVLIPYLMVTIGLLGWLRTFGKKLPYPCKGPCNDPAFNAVLFGFYCAVVWSGVCSAIAEIGKWRKIYSYCLLVCPGWLVVVLFIYWGIASHLHNVDDCGLSNTPQGNPLAALKAPSQVLPDAGFDPLPSPAESPRISATPPNIVPVPKETEIGPILAPPPPPPPLPSASPECQGSPPNDLNFISLRASDSSPNGADDLISPVKSDLKDEVVGNKEVEEEEEIEEEEEVEVASQPGPMEQTQDEGFHGDSIGGVVVGSEGEEEKETPKEEEETEEDPAEQETIEEEREEEDGKKPQKEFWNANEDEENEGDYCKGGYHPVTMGDTYDGYTILDKLGWGQFSTVWLARKNTGHLAALKISKSSPNFTRASLYETNVLKEINETAEKAKDALGSNRVALLLDDFEITGPNGTHIVMALEVCGHNLLKLVTNHDFKGIHKNIVKVICKSVLEGLCFLHDSIGVVHSDIKPENILLENLSPSVLEQLDRPQPERDTAREILFGNWKNTDTPVETAYSCKIGDLGASRWIHKRYPVGVIQTREYRCPEAILGVSHITGAADIWSVACVVFELLTGDFLFDPKSQQDEDRDTYHLALFMQILGEPPEILTTGDGRYADLFFDTNGVFRHTPLEPCSLTALLVFNYHMPRGEAECLSSFLLSMLEFVPSERATAAEALQHPWLVINESDEIENGSYTDTQDVQEDEAEEEEEA